MHTRNRKNISTRFRQKFSLGVCDTVFQSYAAGARVWDSRHVFKSRALRESPLSTCAIRIYRQFTFSSDFNRVFSVSTAKGAGSLAVRQRVDPIQRNAVCCKTKLVVELRNCFWLHWIRVRGDTARSSLRSFFNK